MESVASEVFVASGAMIFRQPHDAEKMRVSFPEGAWEFLRITIDDPHTFVRQWTIDLPMIPSEGPIYEYACHEANVGLYDILEVARDEEKAAAAKGK